MDLSKYSLEQLQELSSIITDFINEKENNTVSNWKKGTILDPENIWDEGYYIAESGDIIEDIADSQNLTLSLKEFGNYFHYEFNAQTIRNEIKRQLLMNHFAQKVNDTTVINWNDATQRKYYIVTVYTHGVFQGYNIFSTTANKIEGVIYFTTREGALKCVNELLIPLDR